VVDTEDVIVDFSEAIDRFLFVEYSMVLIY
jgi:hypothetical protein